MHCSSELNFWHALCMYFIHQCSICLHWDFRALTVYVCECDVLKSVFVITRSFMTGLVSIFVSSDLLLVLCSVWRIVFEANEFVLKSFCCCFCLFVLVLFRYGLFLKSRANHAESTKSGLMFRSLHCSFCWVDRWLMIV